MKDQRVILAQFMIFTLVITWITADKYIYTLRFKPVVDSPSQMTACIS